mgnify:CR=1 FL=1
MLEKSTVQNLYLSHSTPSVSSLRLGKWLRKLMWMHNGGNYLSGAKLRRDSGKVNQEAKKTATLRDYFFMGKNYFQSMVILALDEIH